MAMSSHRVVVCGGGGFSGGHLVKQLLHDGVNVIRTVDIKARNEWYQVHPGVDNMAADLRELDACHRAVDIAEGFAGIRLKRKYNLPGPRGVNGRNSDNTLIQARLGWEPSTLLKDGLRKTYDWIESRSEALACV